MATVTAASAVTVHWRAGNASIAANPGADVSVAAHALPRGELVLDRYRPLRPLGSGGSGSVWLARDERNGLDVALKIVPREGKAGAPRRARGGGRVPAAARALPARLRLRHDSGHVYIAYEYVGGRTLREAMRAGELRDGQAIEAAAQILEGLAHAHGRGIVHRDVKPSNVLLADDDGDLGAAARLRPRAVRRGGDADRGRRRPRDARVHLARAAARRGGLRGERHLGRRDPALGGTRRQAPVLGRAAAADGRDDRGGLPTAPARAAGPAETAARRDLARARARPGQAAARGGAGERVAVGARAEAGARRSVESVVSTQALVPRVAPAALAGAAALAGGMALPFYPTGWAPALAVAAALAAFRSPRAGLALALAAPVLPLGNHALGLAVLYGAVALGWLALSWRDARWGLAFLAGPALAAAGLLALVPVAVVGATGAVRRAAHVLAAVAVAASSPGSAGSTCRSPAARRRHSTSRAAKALSTAPRRSPAPSRPGSRSQRSDSPPSPPRSPTPARPGGSQASAPRCSRPRCCSFPPRPHCRSSSPPGSRLPSLRYAPAASGASLAMRSPAEQYASTGCRTERRERREGTPEVGSAGRRGARPVAAGER